MLAVACKHDPVDTWRERPKRVENTRILWPQGPEQTDQRANQQRLERRDVSHTIASALLQKQHAGRRPHPFCLSTARIAVPSGLYVPGPPEDRVSDTTLPLLLPIEAHVRGALFGGWDDSVPVSLCGWFCQGEGWEDHFLLALVIRPLTKGGRKRWWASTHTYLAY